MAEYNGCLLASDLLARQMENIKTAGACVCACVCVCSCVREYVHACVYA